AALAMYSCPSDWRTSVRVNQREAEQSVKPYRALHLVHVKHGSGIAGFGGHGYSSLRLQRVDNLLSVKTPIFDENLARVPPTDHHPGKMQASYIAFQGFRVKCRLFRMGVQLHAKALDEGKIWMISSQRKHLPRGQPLFASAVLDNHFVRRTRFHSCIEQGRDLTFLIPILDIGPHPILDGFPQFPIAMDQRHARAVAV